MCLTLPLGQQTSVSLQGTSCNLGRERLLIISTEYTPEELNYFSFVSNAYKSYEDAMTKLVNSDLQCQNELLEYSKQVQAIGETGNNHLSYSLILESKKEQIGKENIGLLFEAFNPEITTTGLMLISKLFNSSQTALYIFLFSAYSDMTHRQVVEALNIKNIATNSWTAGIMDLKNPNIIQSNLFVSPWAPSLDLEEFFYQTAETVKELLKDPVRLRIAIPILIASCSTDVGKWIFKLHCGFNFLNYVHKFQLIFAFYGKFVRIRVAGAQDEYLPCQILHFTGNLEI